MITQSPFSSATTRSIKACADAVEKHLAASDIVLTMGGEPTFIPLKPEGAEWTTSALGPTKLDYARKFSYQYLQDYLPGGLITQVSGKQYPGEPLPRWSILLFYRLDGKPLWKSPQRLLHTDRPGRNTPGNAGKFAKALAAKLGLTKHLMSAFEPKTTSGKPDGYALPLDYHKDGWISDTWHFTKKQPLTLIEGDNAMGLRLPLFQLKAHNLRRTLTVQVRNGALEIFIPPLTFESYVRLLEVIEPILRQLNLTDVILCGYPPASDPAFDKLGFASDPGVLEINLPVCRTWAAYHDWIDKLYIAAAKTGLCAHKFNFNGRTLGSGGGAHICFGGPEPLQSPFFHHPHLLPGIVRYWQHHPALSYFFTGLFMGPSSQAPRIDESTFENMYELEIACDGAERFGTPMNHELFALMFRDLLMDRSGNTHRAELSVDKLWNATAPGGCTGIIEFRSFETTPDAATLSLEGLLVRALIAWLAREPFRAAFHRWHPELHDRFMIPSFLWQDFESVINDLRKAGIPIEAQWFRPIFNFRFPTIGTIILPKGEGEITVRHALEPWPLLGEQSLTGSTSRLVDSSTERIEVVLSSPDLIDKGVLLVNGFPVKFRVHGDTAAAAVRFRSFFVVPSLHPTVPVHTPLLLEWVDQENLIVQSAAKFHSWQPDGGNYTERPDNEKEAARRCAERWQPWKATDKTARFIPKVTFPPEGIHTLDLRRYPAHIKA
jgi:uncharacterized protein (DUF2126 family)